MAAPLAELSMSIWSNPELCWEEHHAHTQLTEFLAAHGFEVTPHFAGFETAFLARVNFGDAAAVAAGPTICICAEYDALPGIGHACGHNLISEAAVAAALGVQAGSTVATAGAAGGTLLLMGTPAEESGGGKVEMIRKGCFDGVDVAMMVHPCPADIVYCNFLAVQRVTVTYHGRNAHAAASPDRGINALDAVIAAFNGVAAMRQQFKPAWRAHGVITKGGLKPNVIPALTQCLWYARAPNAKELGLLRAKLDACFAGAAVGAGCTVGARQQCSSALSRRSRSHSLAAHVRTRLLLTFALTC